MKVLIIDDHECWVALATILLAPFAQKVLSAATYKEALVTLNKPNGYDVVLLDLDLPDSPIKNTIARIPEIIGTGRKVVVVTGHNVPEPMAQAALDQGATAVLYKGDANFAENLAAACKPPKHSNGVRSWALMLGC